MTPGGETFGSMLQSAMDRRGFGGGATGKERLRQYLDRQYGIEVATPTLYSWLNDERMPSRGRLLGLLDALGIHGDQRDKAIALWFAHGQPPDDDGAELPPEKTDDSEAA